MRTLFVCEICNKHFTSGVEAYACESRGSFFEKIEPGTIFLNPDSSFLGIVKSRRIISDSHDYLYYCYRGFEYTFRKDVGCCSDCDGEVLPEIVFEIKEEMPFVCYEVNEWGKYAYEKIQEILKWKVLLTDEEGKEISLSSAVEYLKKEGKDPNEIVPKSFDNLIESIREHLKLEPKVWDGKKCISIEQNFKLRSPL